ncbi:homeobox protein BEL1 homolog [Wolffia australiana]
MEPGFNQSYNLFTPQNEVIALRDVAGHFANAKPSPKPIQSQSTHGEFFNPEAFAVESLMAGSNWQENKVMDDASLRYLFPGAQPPSSLSLSLFNCQPLLPQLQLRSSHYLEPTQSLLNEICSLKEGKNEGERKKKAALASGTSSSSSLLSSLDTSELKMRYSQLASLLEELDRRYRRYCEQMRPMVSGFEAAVGAGAAEVYTALAMKAMSRHFRCLRDAMVGQLKEVKRALGEKNEVAGGGRRGEMPRLRLLDRHIRQEKLFQQSGAIEYQPWRPQRGLPERAVTVLRAWLFEHFLHPYPSDVDKHILARQTGLSRSQVCNWFINARVRLWKPMVEEMYLEETKEKLQNPQSDNHTGQSQNPNSLNIQQLQLQDSLSSIEDSLSSVVNSSHHSDHGDDTMAGKNSLGVQYTSMQQLARTDNFGLVDVDFASYGNCGEQQGLANGVSLTLGLQQHAGGVNFCFSPGPQSGIFFSKETQMVGCQPVQFSILEGDAQTPTHRNLMGSPQVLQEFQG